MLAAASATAATAAVYRRAGLDKRQSPTQCPAGTEFTTSKNEPVRTCDVYLTSISELSGLGISLPTTQWSPLVAMAMGTVSGAAGTRCMRARMLDLAIY